VNQTTRQLVVFVHVPKTGGTTLMTCLVASEPHSLRVLNFFKGGGGTAPASMYRHVVRAVREQPAVRLLYGHTPFGIHGSMPADWDVRYITLLRDPVERAVSHYFHQVELDAQGEREPANRKPIDEVPLGRAFSDVLYVPDNLQTRMLCSEPAPFGAVTRELLEQAKENLRTRFAAFCLVERFDESLIVLQRRLGYDGAVYARSRVNGGRPRAEAIPSEIAEAAREANRLDAELYAFANELFDSLPELADPGFQADLSGHLERQANAPDDPEQIRRQARRAGRSTRAQEVTGGPRRRGRRSNRETAPAGATDGSPARQLLLFVHVPKAAGTTVTRLLRTAEPKTWHTANVFKGGGGVALEPQYEQIVEKIREHADARFLHGHTPIAIHSFMPDDWQVRYVTFLRNPVERALSHYFRQVELAGAGRRSGSQTNELQPITDVPLEQRFSGVQYVPDNLHTRMLCGLPRPFGDVTEEMLELAKENLRTRFAVVGLVERIDESLVILLKRLGIESYQFRGEHRVNSRRPRAEDVPQDVQEIAERANRFDVELYRYALELFAEAPELAAPGFDEEVEELREAQAAANAGRQQRRARRAEKRATRSGAGAEGQARRSRRAATRAAGGEPAEPPTPARQPRAPRPRQRRRAAGADEGG